MIIEMRKRKPIFQVEDDVTHNYKYCHKAYILSVEINCFTDLKIYEFDQFLDGKYTGEQIERFEMTGRF